MKKDFPKSKYGLLRGTPFINKNGKKIVIAYAILVVIFMIFNVMNCDNPLLILVMCLANVIFAAFKSNELYKTLINERAKLNDLGEENFVGRQKIGDDACLSVPVVIYFVNYTILNYTFFSIVYPFADSRHLPIWLYFVFFALGIAIYHLGCYVGRNITSILDDEPDILAVEHLAIEEMDKRLELEGKRRRYKDFIEIEKDLKRLITVDLIWTLFSGICSTLWLMNDLGIIGNSHY